MITNLSSCMNAECVVRVLAEQLTAHEPRSLDEWLTNTGWTDEQIAVSLMCLAKTR